MMQENTAQLLPGDEQPTPSGGHSEWALRQAVEQHRGQALSHRQFDDAKKWGVLGDPRCDGPWPSHSVKWLVRFAELREVARSLPRRVLRLRCELAGVPVPPAQLREAM